jgi:adenosylcobinamide-GDP ribazoletransferase
MLNLLRPIATAFAFLTRFPMGARAGGAAAASRTDLADFGRALPWFPLVGAALGSVLGAGARLLEGHLSSGLTALALVAALALLTGGLHLDGLADLFDALGGGRGDRARMLDIMRDSRIGAHGATALFLLLGAKGLALAELAARGSLWPIFASPVVARAAVVPLVIFFRYARPEGLGRAFNGNGRPIHAAAAAAIAVALIAWAGPSVIVPTLSSVLVALGLGLWINGRLGGLTGDVYGAAIEIGEVTFLLASDAVT